MVAKVPPFSSLKADELSTITGLLRSHLTVPGETIVRKGEEGDAMYFIASGAVEVLVEPHPIRLGSGEFFGEMALITGGKRNADIRSLGFCSLLVLKARDFKAVLSASPDVRERIHQTAIARGIGGIRPQKR
jgi:CPA1 family monovalent cation:H+ antiporter